MIGLCFVVRYFMSILVLQPSRWGRESWALCLVLLVSRDGCVALPRGAMGLYAFVIVLFPDQPHLLFKKSKF